MSYNSTPAFSNNGRNDSLVKSSNTVVEFKNPNDYIRKSKPAVLDEETYTSAIDHIIERDFFPDLRFLRERQKEIISLSSPQSTLSSKSKIDSKVEELNLEGGLDDFFKRYTSEDNDSFSELLEKFNSKRKEKMSWLYDEKLSRPKLIENSNTQTSNNSQALVKLDDKSSTETPAKNHENTEGLPRLSKTIQTWNYTPKNSLMYHPDGCYSSLEASESYLRGEPKSISHENTRLKGFNFLSTPSTPSTISTSSGPVKYDLVESTPCPDPSALEGENPMTWGFLDSTPVVLSGASTPGPSFKLPEPKQRELIGIKLSDKARQSLRNRQAKSPYLRNKFASVQSPNSCLSPAARRLLENTQKSRSPLVNGGDRQLREAYSKKGATPSRFSTPINSTISTNFKNLISGTKKSDNK